MFTAEFLRNGVYVSTDANVSNNRWKIIDLITYPINVSRVYQPIECDTRISSTRLSALGRVAPPFSWVRWGQSARRKEIQAPCAVCLLQKEERKEKKRRWGENLLCAPEGTAATAVPSSFLRCFGRGEPRALSLRSLTSQLRDRSRTGHEQPRDTFYLSHSFPSLCVQNHRFRLLLSSLLPRLSISSRLASINERASPWTSSYKLHFMYTTIRLCIWRDIYLYIYVYGYTSWARTS